METQAKQTVTKQFVVNTNESDKNIINNLKEELALSDKSVIRLLIEIASNNREGVVTEDGVSTNVDTFRVLATKLGLSKKEKIAKTVLSKDEKLKIKLEKRMAEIQAQLDSTKTEESEPETLIEIGV